MLQKGYGQVIQQISKGGRAGCWLQTDIPLVIKTQPSTASYMLQRPFLLCYRSVTCIRTGLHTDRLPLELGGGGCQRASLKHRRVKQPEWGSRGLQSQGKVKKDPTNPVRSSIAEPLRWVMLLLAYANVATIGTFVFLNQFLELFHSRASLFRPRFLGNKSRY